LPVCAEGSVFREGRPARATDRARAHLEQRNEATDVGLHVGQRLLERVAHARLRRWWQGRLVRLWRCTATPTLSPYLRGQVDDVGHAPLTKQQLEKLAVADVALEKAEEGAASGGRCAEVGCARGLEFWVVVMVEIVQANDGVTLRVELLRRVIAHKARHARQQHHAAAARPVRFGKLLQLGLDPPGRGRVVLGHGTVVPPQDEQSDERGHEGDAASAAEQATHHAVRMVRGRAVLRPTSEIGSITVINAFTDLK